MVMGLIGYLLWVDFNLALIFLFVLPPAAIGLRYLGKKLRKAIRESLEEIGTLSSLVSETLKGIRIIKAYRKENFYTKKAKEIIKKVVSLSMRGVRARSASAPIMEIVTGFAIAGIIYYAGGKSISGDMSVGSFMAFTTAAGLLYDPLKAVANLQAMLQEGVAASQRLFPIIDNEPKIVEKIVPEDIEIPSGLIEFNNVSFSYSENNDEMAVEDISLVIQPGETVALVGPSGAGKTTLLNLVPRFYDPSKGLIRIDNIDLKDLPLKTVRNASALVSQDALIFDASIKENIIFGSTKISQEQFKIACKEALVDDFVSDLPNGYETFAGESGVKLSGGQKQRIAIARAMIKNSPILLLDEATSSLDSEAESKVQIALEALLKEKSALIIAHRLSTIKNADMIYVFDKGRIVEKGKHKELLEKNGLYEVLFKTQFPEGDID